MDYADEILQVLTTLYKKAIGINKDVILITDEEHWFLLYPKDDRFNKYKGIILGACKPEDGYIFIDLDKNATFKELAATLLHEMLHLKYPNISESRIEKLTRKYLN